MDDRVKIASMALAVIGIVAVVVTRQRFHAVHQKVYGKPVVTGWLRTQDPDEEVDSARRRHIVAGAFLVLVWLGLVWIMFNW